MHRPARTFVLPVPLSRMLAAYTGFDETRPNIGTEIIIPVTNPIERRNGEIKRRTDVVGIFPTEASIRRLVGAIIMEQTEEWTVQRGRYLTLETLAPVCDDVIVSLPAAQRD